MCKCHQGINSIRCGTCWLGRLSRSASWQESIGEEVAVSELWRQRGRPLPTRELLPELPSPAAQVGTLPWVHSKPQQNSIANPLVIFRKCFIRGICWVQDILCYTNRAHPGHIPGCSPCNARVISQYEQHFLRWWLCADHCLSPFNVRFLAHHGSWISKHIHELNKIHI